MSRAPIRLIDAGTVPFLRSQTIFHGLAHARGENTPDTIVLVTPREPYVCIGFHQDLEHEVDVDFCREWSLPVVRRETGGGAVYCDAEQLFVQWVMAPSALPPRVEQRFELFARPLAATYRRYGIDADLRPPNDVHVGGRKIVGTGAARIGEAEVLVGNFIFDFDTDVMGRVLRAPSSAFREQVARSLRRYMTSMRRELAVAPDPAEVGARYVEECERALGRDLRPGTLTPAEARAVAAVDARFADEEFVHRSGGLRRSGVKIHADVHVVEAAHGPIRATARVRAGAIEEIELDGDGVGRELESALAGVELAPEPVARAVQTARGRRPAGGVDADTLVRAVLDLRPS